MKSINRLFAASRVGLLGIFVLLISLTLFISSSQAQSPLPRPSHPIHFGYYKVDSNYGPFFDEVRNYTNAQIIEQQAFLRPPPDYNPQGFRDALQRVISANHSLWVEMQTERNGATVEDIGKHWDTALDILRDYWEHVDYIYLTDEPNWDRDLTQRVIDRFIGVFAPCR